MIKNSVVVDTNMIFSSLLSKNSKIRQILLDNEYTFYAPNFLISEIFKHKDKLKKYSTFNDDEFYQLFNTLVEKIQFVPLEIISIESKQLAYDLCKDIDLNDIPFIALTIELKSKLWTGDKKLKDSLMSKGFLEFIDL